MPFDPPPVFRRALVDPAIPALEVGAAFGVSGLALGGVAGLFTSAHPVMFSTVAGAQCFFLGSSYTYTRGALLASVFTHRSKSNDLAASGVAGLVSGAAAGALRSRSNVIPGAIVIGLMGMTIQGALHAVEDASVSNEGQKPLFERFTEMRWVPFRSLSDTDYEKMLNEKLLRIEADISLVDGQLAELRQSRSNIEGGSSSESKRT